MRTTTVLLGLTLLVPPIWAEEVESPLTEKDRSHWSFVAPVRPSVPKIEAPLHNEIDHFIHGRLQKKGLTFTPRADRTTLLRRLSFDLTGLPPTPREIDAFLADRSPGAYERQVDRLLASPAYGERWAQHWLDVARYAESDGFEFDHERKEAWRYRDWVIQALNEDLPYDRFVHWQLAGDELTTEDKPVHATGFLVAGPDMIDINLATERRHEFLNKMTQTIGESLLGLTVGCAQCHTHKTDPISIDDFYRLRAFFANTVVNPRKSKQLPPTVRETAKPPSSFVMQRGDFRRPGREVQPAFLRITNPVAVAVPGKDPTSISSHRRSALARWLTRPNHPLTGRVIVNRLWQHHFGQGIVSTANDFGHTGLPPSHPNLLDWLATELPRRHWSLKSMHRLMVTSRTYRQSSHGAGPEWQASLQQDPSNELLSRMPRRRLEGEAIRDSLLAAAGLLNRKRGGPSIRPPLPKEVTSTLLRNQWVVTKDASEHDRRSVYIFVRRNLRFPFFDVFDRPDTTVSCPRRNETTTATQSLTLLNSEFSFRIAKTLAHRVEDRGDRSHQVAALYRLLFARFPSQREQTIASHLLDSGGTLADLSLALLNTNEAIYID